MIQKSKKGAISIISLIIIMLGMTSILYMNVFWKVSERYIEAQSAIDNSVKTVISESIFFPALQDGKLYLYCVRENNESTAQDNNGFRLIGAYDLINDCSLDEDTTKSIIPKIYGMNSLSSVPDDIVSHLDFNNPSVINGSLFYNYKYLLMGIYNGGLRDVYYETTGSGAGTRKISLQNALNININKLHSYAFLHKTDSDDEDGAKHKLGMAVCVPTTIDIGYSLPGMELMLQGFNPTHDVSSRESVTVSGTEVTIPIYSSFEYIFEQ